jgi:hypothetical protein
MSITERGGNVVDDDRQRRRLGHRGEMRIEAALGRPVIVGRDHEHCIRADGFGIAHQADRLFRVVRTGAGDDRHTALCHLDADLHHLAVLVMRQRRRLAGGADRNEAVAAFTDLPFDMRGKRVLIDGAGIGERGDESGMDPLNIENS